MLKNIEKALEMACSTTCDGMRYPYLDLVRSRCRGSFGSLYVVSSWPILKRLGDRSLDQLSDTSSQRVITMEKTDLLSVLGEDFRAHLPHLAQCLGKDHPHHQIGWLA